MTQYEETKKEITLRDFYASQAMIAVMGETQEMRVASVWDWVKYLLQSYLHFNFLTVKYVKVKNVYEEAAERCFQYADAMIKERENKNNMQ